MVLSSVLGFPRIGTDPLIALLDLFSGSADLLYLLSSSGANREVKKAVEAYWAGKISAEELTKAAADVKKASWTSLKESGVDFIPRSVSIA